jgi:hypothetical protein
LSRFIGGNKKKGSPDTASDNGTEADDSRPEGMDAQLYVDNLSFSPTIPQPPAYIKVRTKFKKAKEFDRVLRKSCVRAQTRRARLLLDRTRRPSPALLLRKIPYGHLSSVEMEDISRLVDRTEPSACGR